MIELRCDECSACCKIIGVRELSKRPGAPCQHQCAKGCAIYASRPKTCIEFRCLWLDGALGDSVILRPDNLGIVFYMSDSTPFADSILVAHEVKPGATKEGETYEILTGLSAQTLVLVKSEDNTVLLGPQELIDQAIARARGQG